MKAYTFSMHISYQQFLRHYSGAASNVLVMTDNGLRLQLPASRLRPFLSQLGIRGRFRVTVSESNKLQAIEQIM
ncbi:DUF2835 domain-containing protein [Photobacterium gaetbulicola]|uniref:DUF2835 domain-containing protein n=1 Tax=Photobacterium gaetbulicola Gung47 TaxID=658445 RepID=A0A0C5WNC0_9GAMM|nr:DUF2835 domain-containing protein [Photobacterium gaetbulicola]AJR08618.1 hypothetical protein H744_2c1954 [Photobacterium gaetbulicola Gung47]PSU02965.1 DUF2835 domain-containing protein [Photobacterium gaetbulicola]